MKLRRKHPHGYLGALLLAPAYLFIVVCHLLFLPKLQAGPNSAGQPVVKGDTQLVYYLVRNDRSAQSDNKTSKTFPKTRTLMASERAEIAPGQFSIAQGNPASHLLTDQHYTWLANRVMRI